MCSRIGMQTHAGRM